MAALAFAGDAQPWQRSLRWTRPAPNRRAIAAGVALALFLTAIELGLFDVEMRREIARSGHAPPDQVLHVDLIEEERPVEPPAVEPAPVYPVPMPVEHRPRTRAAQRVPAHAPNPAPIPSQDKPRLFGLDGHILLPDEHAPTGAPNELSQHVPKGDAFARTNPVPYQPTRFDQYFPDVRESLGGEIMRKTTLTYEWLTPWGTRWVCKSNLLLLGMGGCGWGPAPRLTADQMHAIRADPPPVPLLPNPVPPATSDPPDDQSVVPGY